MKQNRAEKLLLKILFFVLLAIIEPLETKMNQLRQYETHHAAHMMVAENLFYKFSAEGEQAILLSENYFS